MDDKSIAKYISYLASNDSSGHDGISLKLLMIYHQFKQSPSV